MIKKNPKHQRIKNRSPDLTETIIFYGNCLSRTDTVYMHFKEKTHVNHCMIHCNVPLTLINHKEQIPRDIGTLLELSGTQSSTMCTAPYFHMDSLFPGNKSCLFFKAQLQIVSIWCDAKRYDMSPLSLYDSILNGSVITLRGVVGDNTVPLTASHPDI
eukprot:1162195_1